MSILTEQISHFIEPILVQMGYEFVGIEYIRAKINILRVYIDKDSGIIVDDCILVSDQVGAILDVEDVINSQYHLEVSSPGVERPLFILEHYRRFFGHQIKVYLFQANNGKRKFIGEMKAVYEKERSIELVVGLESVVLLLENIQKANLIADF
jgi:ribosome maturation factor RimP